MEKENELPLRTQTFLKNIGIGIDPSSPTSPLHPHQKNSNRQTHNEQKTKLVSHVFDCLGALEELVELDQNSVSGDLHTLNDTQSVCDRNINSVGKLIHELVSIYGLCGDSLKVSAQMEWPPLVFYRPNLREWWRHHRCCWSLSLKRLLWKMLRGVWLCMWR